MIALFIAAALTTLSKVRDAGSSRVRVTQNVTMTKKPNPKLALKDGQHCVVVGGTHTGKSGTVRDINTSKTGHVTITVEQASGVCFKTLAKNVVVQKRGSRT